MLVSNFSRYLGIWSYLRVLSYGTLPGPRPNLIITYTVVVMTGWAVKLWKTRKWHTVLIYWPAIILPDFTLNTIRWVLERMTWHMSHLTLEKCTLTVFHVAAGCVYRPGDLRKAHWPNISAEILSVLHCFSVSWFVLCFLPLRHRTRAVNLPATQGPHFTRIRHPIF